MITKVENPQSDCLKKHKTFEGVNAENSKDIIKTNFSYLKTFVHHFSFRQAMERTLLTNFQIY